MPRRRARVASAVVRDRETTLPRVLKESVDDRARVLAFEPSVGGRGAFARAVGPRVHHHHAVARTQQEFRLTGNADAVVRHAMKQQHPRAVGIRRRDLPAAQQHAVGRAHVERLAVRVGDREGSIGFANQVGCKLAPDGVQIRGRDQPPGHRRQHRRQEQQNQHHANDSSTHGGAQQASPRLEHTHEAGREFLPACRSLCLTFHASTGQKANASSVSRSPDPARASHQPSYTIKTKCGHGVGIGFAERWFCIEAKIESWLEG